MDSMDNRYTAELDFPAAFAVPARCPACGEQELFNAGTEGEPLFECAACAIGWWWESGMLVRTSTPCASD
ncbi:hypothetical protein [Sciscionella sediminilitoris]|uniref:hypothetical protein n=1 Tax=Sciscionella sediminilitoris TaxID=1445613 RepID=UPI0012E252C9|nr:hypothetical protein [Sciscionella sp. SE31]